MKQRPQLQKKWKPPQNQPIFPKLIVKYNSKSQNIHFFDSNNLYIVWSQIKSKINKTFGFDSLDILYYIYEFQQDIKHIKIDKDYQIFCQSTKNQKQAIITVLNEPINYLKQEQSQVLQKKQKIKEEVYEQQLKYNSFKGIDFTKFEDHNEKDRFIKFEECQNKNKKQQQFQQQKNDKKYQSSRDSLIQSVIQLGKIVFKQIAKRNNYFKKQQEEKQQEEKQEYEPYKSQKNQNNESIIEDIKPPNLSVCFQDEFYEIPYYGYVTPNFKQLKNKIQQKLKLKNQYKEIFSYLKYLYIDPQSNDFKQIRNQQDFIIFQKSVKNQASTTIYLNYLEEHQQQDQIKKIEKNEIEKEEEKQQLKMQKKQQSINLQEHQDSFLNQQEHQGSFSDLRSSENFQNQNQNKSRSSQNSFDYMDDPISIKSQLKSQISYSLINQSMQINSEQPCSDPEEKFLNNSQKSQENHQNFQKKKFQDFIWVHCRLCKIKKQNNSSYKEQQRIKKYICTFCNQENVYCQTCIKQEKKVCCNNLKNKNKEDPECQLHQLMEMPMGSQQKLLNLRYLRQEKQKQSQRQKSFTYVIPQQSFVGRNQIKKSTQIFLIQEIKKIFSQTKYLEQKGQSKKSDQILQNFINLNKTDLNQIIKKICILNSILQYENQQSGKEDMFKFIRYIGDQSEIKKIQKEIETRKQSVMLYIYSRYVEVYRTMNLALKQKSIFQDPTRLSVFRYPIKQLWKEIHQKYNQNKKNVFVPFQEPLYSGAKISEQQIKKFSKGDIISISDFLSTSKDPSIAQGLKKNSLIKIQMPQKRANFSDKCPGYYQFQDEQSQHNYEQEVIFNIFSKFRVKNIDIKTFNDYEITLQYLELPELITNQNIQQIQKQYQISSDNGILSKIQHLQLFSRQKMDQGKCLNILNKINFAKIFYYQKQKLIKLRLQNLLQRRMEQSKDSTFKYIQKMEVLKLQLANVYMSLGEVFRKQNNRKSKNIYKAYSQMSQIYFKSCNIQNLSNQSEQEKAKIQFNFYSRYFKFFPTINLRILQKRQNKYISPKMRKMAIQATQKMANISGKMTSIQNYGSQFLSIFSNLTKELQKQDANDKQVKKKSTFQKCVLKGFNFLLSNVHQYVIQQQKQSLFQISSKNYQQSNLLIKWHLPLTNFMKTMFQFQNVGQMFTIQDLQKSYKILLNCREIFVKNKEKYFEQISQINLMLAVYYFSQHEYKKSKQQIQKNQTLIRDNFNKKSFLWANHKDVLAYLQFMDEMKKSEEQIKIFQKYKRFCQESLELKRQLWGKEHINLFIPIHNLGIFYFMIDDCKKSLEWFIEAQKLLQKNNQGFDHYRQLLYYNIAMTHKKNESMKKGEEYMQKYLKVKFQTFKTNNTGFDQYEAFQYVQNKAKQQQNQLLSQFARLFFNLAKKSFSQQIIKENQMYKFKRKKQKQ